MLLLSKQAAIGPVKTRKQLIANEARSGAKFAYFFESCVPGPLWHIPYGAQCVRIKQITKDRSEFYEEKTRVRADRRLQSLYKWALGSAAGKERAQLSSAIGRTVGAMGVGGVRSALIRRSAKTDLWPWTIQLKFSVKWNI